MGRYFSKSCNNIGPLGSSCGSVGRAVASNARGPVIGKLLYQTLNCLPDVNCIEKTKIKKKRPGMAPIGPNA